MTIEATEKFPCIAFLTDRRKPTISIPSKKQTMQSERAPQPKEIRVTRLVPEQAVSAMQQALMELLHDLPTPITITEQKDTRQQTYYTYQVGEKTEQHPQGLAMGATPDFLDFD